MLVCGATGYLGRYVVKAAAERGHWVRALVRDPERLGEAKKACDHIFVGHATRAATLEGLCEGIDVVISSLGNRTLKRKPTCWEVDQGANMNIVAEAERANVEQFIFVSVLRGEEARKRVPQIEARERVVDALAESDLAATIIRPSGFYNDMSEFFEMARKGTIWLPGGGKTKFNPIHGADLAAAIVDHIGNRASFGQHYPMGGPDVLTMREIGELAFAALDKKPRFRSLPAWTMRALALIVRPLNVNVSSLIAMFHAFIAADAVTETFGTHHLGDFFAELAAAADTP